MATKDSNSLTDPLYKTREEDKFIIALPDLDTVIDVVEDHLKPYYAAPSTEYNLQRSLYYDSKDFKFLRDHLKGLPTRYKMRLRQYGPNGKWNQEAFIEVKYRENNEQKKLRLRIDNYSETCLGHERLSEKTMRRINPEIADADFKDAYDLINYVSMKYEVTKVSNVTYKRLSYKGGSVRMGLDTNVKVAARRRASELSGNPLRKDSLWDALQNYDSRYHPDMNAIVEIKHPEDKDTPQWFQDLMNKVDDPFEGFSKFVWSMSQILK